VVAGQKYFMTTSKLHEINTSAQPEVGARRGRDRMLNNFAVWPAPPRPTRRGYAAGRVSRRWSDACVSVRGVQAGTRPPRERCLDGDTRPTHITYCRFGLGHGPSMCTASEVVLVIELFRQNYELGPED